LASSEGRRVLRAWMIDQLTAVQLSGHRPASPQGGCVEAGGIQRHLGDDHSGPMTGESTHDFAIGANDEAAPAGGFGGAVVGADPEVILGRTALHGCGDDGFPDVVLRVDHHGFP